MNSLGEDHISLGETSSPTLAISRQDSLNVCFDSDLPRQLSLGLARREVYK
ncbi:hypothetical protein A2U01_0050293 [Trifolium medium]|uniref:Uncharacterized protein n=1 Tax=Trifolium medium TaxID=97028 RepID=A0A392QYI1_9FABA|nr:hypothetical protein [Trifolium medium]